jgi:molecular chaperone GrpE
MSKKETKSEKTKEKKVTPKQKKEDELQSKLNELQAEVLELTKQNDELKKELEDSRDSSLRAMAEVENVKRRKEQEKMDAIKFANERLVLDLLPVLDGFDLAMSQTVTIEPSEFKAVFEGFSMIKKQMEQFLEKCNVEPIEAIDQPFDPNIHQGISQESHPDKDENTVVKEMQKGYRLKDRVIRPAMVVVSTK